MKPLGKVSLFCFSLFVYLSARTQVPPYVSTLGLGGWWSFSGNYNDQSSFANNATNNGTNLVLDRFSNESSAINCDGVSQFVSVPHPNDNSLDPGVSGFTVAGWIRSSNSTTANPIVEKKDFNGYVLWMAIAGNMKFRIEDTNANTIDVVSPSNLYNDGQWHHVVGIRNVALDSVLLYVDGVLVASQMDPTDSSVECSEPLSIGRWPGSYWTDGDLDDIGFWKRALDACEVQDLYNSGLNSIESTISADSNLLNADQLANAYQWIDCDNNNAPIDGETNQFFAPDYSGNFAVEVTVNGCSAISNCMPFVYTGVEELPEKQKQIVKIIDFLGRETEFKANTPLIFIYEDGTRERVYRFQN